VSLENSSFKYITTWLYLEGVEENGYYPQIRGKSSSIKVHDIYKRCLVTFFKSAKTANPEAKLILFSNVDIRKGKRTIDYRLINILNSLNVQIVQLQYSFRPPLEQKKWRNQFFVLDILTFLAENCQNQDLCIVLDGDIVWSGNSRTPLLWEELQSNGSLTMLPITDENEEINGVKLSELEEIAKSLNCYNAPIKYAGGEFIALRGDKLKDLTLRISRTWDDYLKEVSMKKIPLLEEAHFLSILYSSMNIRFGDADIFIRRIWTQILHYQNRINSDINLILWHLPAEKRFGIRRVANEHLVHNNRKWPSVNSKEWKRLTANLGIEKNMPKKSFFDICTIINDRATKIK
jgi:hypothetical protein